MIIEYIKKVGETMMEMMERFKEEYKITHNRITYAGRLDPLAFGNIIILTDDDIYRKKEFCNLKKEYECWIIKDIKTDTFDIMGLIINNDKKEEIKIEIGEYEQQYPQYSSYKVECKVEGKIKKMSLWMATKKGYEIMEKKTKKITLYEYEKLEDRTINKIELLEMIKDRIDRVKPQTFRQEEIKEEWNKIEDREYKIEKYRFMISSGGYIRYIGNKMGGCCFDIERKKFIK
jgi:tRNA U55 pseudouridine synthase TruB